MPTPLKLKSMHGGQSTEIFEIMNKLKEQSLDIEDERNRLDFIDLENLKKKNIQQLYVQMLVENNFAKKIQKQYKEFVLIK